MIFCDIGNTNAHLLKDGHLYIKSVKEFLNLSFNEKVYYICVNDDLNFFLDKNKNFFDLKPYIDFDTKYKGMGIDRICACKAVNDGVVVDAGSAITVDIMENGTHAGGYILPGLAAYETAYALISSRLKLSINKDVKLDVMPENTRDAISYAAIKSIKLIIKNSAKDRKIYFSGGDGKYLAGFFKNAVYDQMLIFKVLKETFDTLKSSQKGTIC
ncbi:MAG: type III pantothenate kinase [Campylobacteraceae bacterium]|nr:type III pantothenate kinase [Campylobacteraceae bacterium]